ncbi:MAG: hypothetical protein KDB32_11320 [Planctomycetes bacterium]|nr:hypothetical protein [Planctomycetota bacterium]
MAFVLNKKDLRILIPVLFAPWLIVLGMFAFETPSDSQHYVQESRTELKGLKDAKAANQIFSAETGPLVESGRGWRYVRVTITDYNGRPLVGRILIKDDDDYLDGDDHPSTVDVLVSPEYPSIIVPPELVERRIYEADTLIRMADNRDANRPTLRLAFFVSAPVVVGYLVFAILWIIARHRASERARGAL